MAKRVAISNINASTADILNTIRANASQQYQSLVPTVAQEKDVPKVGDILMGYPAMANEFLTALINRIAMVKIKSATFNNAYAKFKKGYLEYGETVEEVFVGIAKAREFSPEKAASREFKRTLPDVRSAFHIMNYKVQYPITIQNEDLRQAFTGYAGVEDMIARIIDGVTTANEYDEFLLFKYMLIKAIAHGKMYVEQITGTDMKADAIKYRAISNTLPFLKKKYNVAGVHTTTPKADQEIFMDAEYNAKYDVNVLAGAFNMDKADFMGKLNLIDDWTTFDNERFDIIRENSDMIEEVTTAELELMRDVKAVLIDAEWFQVYDNLLQMSEQYVASGLYWNYFLNSWKTVSSSPFSNAVVFVGSDASVSIPSEITAEITGKSVGEEGTVLTLTVGDDAGLINGSEGMFEQNADATEKGVAVHKYGAYVFPANADDVAVSYIFRGVRYVADSDLSTLDDVGDTFTLTAIDNTLSALQISADGEAIALTPAFDKTKNNYTATVDISELSSTTATLTFTASDERSTVTAKAKGADIVSGGTFTLTAGTNGVVINVDDGFGNTLTYTVVISGT